jgi:methionyl aminopeptidase
MIILKTPDEIAVMAKASRVVAEALLVLKDAVKPGVTTDQLDKLAHDYIVFEQNATPAPLNYAPPGYTPYPKSICTSINHQV